MPWGGRAGQGGGEGGLGGCIQGPGPAAPPVFVYQKWPDQIFPIVISFFSHNAHFGLEGGGSRGGGAPPMVGRSNGWLGRRGEGGGGTTPSSTGPRAKGLQHTWYCCSTGTAPSNRCAVHRGAGPCAGDAWAGTAWKGPQGSG